ncbi:polysaccharide deacetylase family protein [uncultured Streptomyces sp.]|uniref:polysaccharide deacetylase family protein n=1 Tax=uncultured Streptomyces sp. TaxID=174707 RepID=UPI002611A24D|nr:polysaccharide deacetylase family protein [uncultured Streptomyces sp.]
MVTDPSARVADPHRRAARPGGAAQPWILTYHSVGDPTDDPYGITVSAERLGQQLAWLRSRRLVGVGVAALLRAHAQGRRGLVGLTFDDGYGDFLDQGLPVLRRYGCTATVFVLPGRLAGQNDWDPLGPRKTLLTERQIRSLADAGMEVGSHGLYHQDLTALGDAELRAETRHSRDLLREITGTAPAGFCYPYGVADPRVVDAVRDAGYAYGCALRPGPLAGEHALPRTHVSHADLGLRLRAKELRHRMRHRAGRTPSGPPPTGIRRGDAR